VEPFVVLEHPADIGIEAQGATVKELFSNAARGMFTIMLGAYGTEKCLSFTVERKGRDRENLLVLWLNELLFLFETKAFVFTDASFDELSESYLRATVYGEEYKNDKHEVQVEIKAITYHHLKIEEKDKILRAQIYFDI